MDLVTSTLDRYLKHRFNGNGIGKKKIDLIQQQHQNQQPKAPTIHHIDIGKLKPCCVSIRDDLRFFAAGFENSHIYLWFLKNCDLTNKIEIHSMHTLLAHTGSIYGIEFVKNNDLMLSCSEDTTIRLWCLKNKCNVFIYRGHNYPIWSLEISAQGSLFASASMDTTARLWCLNRITPIRIFCGHDDDVECVKFHPNEKYIATGSSDTTIRLWSTSDGKMVRLMVGHKAPIISLSFLPNGKFLASASRDGSIKIWNLATNLATSELMIPASVTISFNLDQNFISSCGTDNVLRIYQLIESDCQVPASAPDKQEEDEEKSSTSNTSKLIEKTKLNFQTSNLIQSKFIQELNKLFVVGSSANLPPPPTVNNNCQNSNSNNINNNKRIVKQ